MTERQKLNDLFSSTPEECTEIREYVECSRYDREIYEELKDNLICIFGNDYESLFIIPGRHPKKDRVCEFSQYEKGCRNSVDLTQSLLFSLRGRIYPIDLAFGGINAGKTGKDYAYAKKFAEEVVKNIKAVTGIELIPVLNISPLAISAVVEFHFADKKYLT